MADPALTPSPLLSLRGLGLARQGRQVLRDISLEVGPGEFVGLIGPNGAGKTSLLRAIMGLIPASGHGSLAALAPRARARAAAFLPQSREIAWPVTVGRLAGLGRAALGAGAAADAQAVTRALAALGLEGLRNRPASELSGGEQARALLARALAQEAPLLLADEPTAGLDPAAALGALEIFAALAAGGGAVIASLHDLGLAARFCTRLLVLHDGRLVADGPPDAVLEPELVARVFGIRARLDPGPDGAGLIPLGRIPGAGGR